MADEKKADKAEKAEATDAAEAQDTMVRRAAAHTEGGGAWPDELLVRRATQPEQPLVTVNSERALAEAREQNAPQHSSRSRRS